MRVLGPSHGHTRRTAGATLLVALVLASCAPQTPLRPVVEVALSEGASEAFQAAIARSELPSSVGGSPVVYRRRYLGEETMARGLTDSADSGDLGLDRIRVESHGFFTDPAGVPIAVRSFAPVVDFLDPRSSVSADDVLAGRVDVLPLDEVALPRKALAVDGMYPDHPDYPLRERVVVDFDRGIAELVEWSRRVRVEEAEPVDFVASVGDMMVSRGVDDILIRGAGGLERIFNDTLGVLQGADLTIGNLEGAVTRATRPWPKSYTFRFHPEVVGPLRQAGFDYLSLANNHAFDFYEEGFVDTLEYLQAGGIATSGAGMNLDEATLPWIAGLDGVEVRILSVGAFPAESSYDGNFHSLPTEDRAGMLFANATFFEALAQGFGPESYDIVMVHGGYEYHARPHGRQRELYRSMIDAGADLVVGHHPHVLQGIEAYNGGLIAYSLGNFIFPGMFMMENAEESLILRVGVVGGRPRYIDYIPAVLNHQIVRLDQGTAILDRFLALSREFR